MTQDTEVATYNWSPDRYIELVEHTKDPTLHEFQLQELDYLNSHLRPSREKTVIDVGAGYGRVLSLLTSVADKVIAVELDENMLTELRRRATGHSNVDVVEGDANHLSKLLEGKIARKPIVLCLQNTLGTWKGDYLKVVDEMRKVAQPQHGEVIISVLRQQALRDVGIDMYVSLKELVGEPDYERTNLEKGIFRSKTGYKSKWWTDAEIEEMIKRLGSQKIDKTETPNFIIFCVSY